jgi:predicted amidohydrolase
LKREKAMRSSKVSIVQMESSEDKRENLKRALQYVDEAKSQGARMVVFPEFLMAFSPSSQTPRQLADLAERTDGGFATSLRRSAKENGIHVLATMYEKSEARDRVYDTAIFIGPDGRLLGRYRKLHLYDAFGFKESEKFVAGNEVLPPVGTDIGKFGFMICYDLRFPEHARLLALGGAQSLLVPSGWVFGSTKEEHWFTMLKARALENGLYVVAPAQVGNIYTGRSALVDPFGVVQYDLGQGEKLVTAEMDLGRVEEARIALPLLKNRRADAYQLTSRRKSAESDAVGH